MNMIQIGFKELSANTNTPATSSQWSTDSHTPTHMDGNVLHFVCHANNKKSLSVDK